MIPGLLGSPPVSRVLPEGEGVTGDGDRPASLQDAPAIGDSAAGLDTHGPRGAIDYLDTTPAHDAPTAPYSAK